MLAYTDITNKKKKKCSGLEFVKVQNLHRCRFPRFKTILLTFYYLDYLSRGYKISRRFHKTPKGKVKKNIFKSIGSLLLTIQSHES
jgi:hypothetical protein